MDLRALPPAHTILGSSEARRLAEEMPRDALRALLHGVMDDVRARLLAGELPGDRAFLIRHTLGELAQAARRAQTPGLRRVINATGVLLHTNLGRAPLGDEVLAHVAEVSRGYATLEYDLDRGRRGQRDASVVPWLKHLVGAEDALVVNNCAAAVLLGCSALASGREVVISRGELVEIGGGFRVPEVISSCGARLVEVGTTNRTRVDDYARAITADTGLLLRVHRSNFALVGFTAEASREELVALGRARGVPVIEDLGSGALFDTAALGLPAEPTVRESLAAGVDLVMCSGDKLLGGPQAGIVVGRHALIDTLRKHPLARALRPGRLVLSALEATLRVYASGKATTILPTLRALSESPDTVSARAHALLRHMGATVERHGVTATVVDTVAKVGGGTMPTARLPSYAVRISGGDAVKLEAALRAVATPVIARIEEGAVLLDLRAVADGEIDALGVSVASALERVKAPTNEVEVRGPLVGSDEGADDLENWG